MLAPKHERRRLALRAAIQMGGASIPLSQAVEDLITTVAFWLSDEDTCKCIAFITQRRKPRAADAGRPPEADVERILNGYYWKDWR